MKKVWRRNLVVLTAMVFVGAAAYLNYNYGQDALAEQTGKVLGESVQVDENENEDGEETVAVGASADDYFSTARLTRKEARDKSKSLLEEAANKPGATQSVLDEASKGIQKLAEYTSAEATIESLVTAKGYDDCVAFMSADSISVVVAAGEDGLGSTDIVKITDIVLEQTGFTADQIKIMEAN